MVTVERQTDYTSAQVSNLVYLGNTQICHTMLSDPARAMHDWAFPMFNVKPEHSCYIMGMSRQLLFDV